MTTIHTSSAIAEIIRAQVSSLSRAPKQEVGGKTSKKRTSTTTSKNRDIADLIVSRTNAISPDDPNRASKAFRIFLESVLAAEFGIHLINDPRFFTMVEAVQKQMEEDAELKVSIELAMGNLLIKSKSTKN